MHARRRRILARSADPGGAALHLAFSLDLRGVTWHGWEMIQTSTDAVYKPHSLRLLRDSRFKAAHGLQLLHVDLPIIPPEPGAHGSAGGGGPEDPEVHGAAWALAAAAAADAAAAAGHADPPALGRCYLVDIHAYLSSSLLATGHDVGHRRSLIRLFLGARDDAHGAAGDSGSEPLFDTVLEVVGYLPD